MKQVEFKPLPPMRAHPDVDIDCYISLCKRVFCDEIRDIASHRGTSGFSRRNKLGHEWCDSWWAQLMDRCGIYSMAWMREMISHIVRYPLSVPTEVQGRQRDDIVLPELSQRIKSLTKQRGWTIRELSRRAGDTNYSYVRHIVHADVKAPSMGWVQRIAVALEVEVEELVA